MEIITIIPAKSGSKSVKKYKTKPLLVYKIYRDIENFKAYGDVIVANRYNTVLDDVREKVYARDIFKRD